MQYTLENTNLRVTFSENAALTELLNKNSSWSIQRRPELAFSFIAYLPIKDRRNNPIHGINQTLANIKQFDNALTFTWHSLTSEHGGNHSITLKLTAELNDDELSCRIDLDNQSNECIETIAWPCIGDLNRPDDIDQMATATPVNHTLLRNEIYPKFANNKGGALVSTSLRNLCGVGVLPSS